MITLLDIPRPSERGVSEKLRFQVSALRFFETLRSQVSGLRFFGLVILAVTSILHPAHAAVYALDNAGNYASTGWGTTGQSYSQDNVGIGFDKWGFFNEVADGTQNGSFLAFGTDIDTAGNAWGLYANNGQRADAIAPFLNGGALSAGQHLTFRMQNGSIQPGGSVGFSLRNATHENLFEFYFRGGEQFYKINIGGEVETELGWTSGALALDFTQGNDNSWNFAITTSGQPTYTYSSAAGYKDLGGSITEIRFFNTNAGPYNNVYFNDLAAVPEPAHYGLICAAGLIGIAILRTRKTAAGSRCRPLVGTTSTSSPYAPHSAFSLSRSREKLRVRP